MHATRWGSWQVVQPMHSGQSNVTLQAAHLVDSKLSFDGALKTNFKLNFVLHSTIGPCLRRVRRTSIAVARVRLRGKTLEWRHEKSFQACSVAPSDSLRFAILLVQKALHPVSCHATCSSQQRLRGCTCALPPQNLPYSCMRSIVRSDGDKRTLGEATKRPGAAHQVRSGREARGGLAEGGRYGEGADGEGDALRAERASSLHGPAPSTAATLLALPIRSRSARRARARRARAAITRACSLGRPLQFELRPIRLNISRHRNACADSRGVGRGAGPRPRPDAWARLRARPRGVGSSGCLARRDPACRRTSLGIFAGEIACRGALGLWAISSGARSTRRFFAPAAPPGSLVGASARAGAVVAAIDAASERRNFCTIEARSSRLRFARRRRRRIGAGLAFPHAFRGTSAEGPLSVGLREARVSKARRRVFLNAAASALCARRALAFALCARSSSVCVQPTPRPPLWRPPFSFFHLFSFFSLFFSFPSFSSSCRV